MNKMLFSLIISLTAMTVFAQNQTTTTPIVSPDNDIVYRLFSTYNIGTFIKLNTKNGQMWQVQWDAGKGKFESPLFLTPRVSAEEEKNGRFFLYPTTNIYNFILIDQLDGRMWQVQWSSKIKDRIVLPLD
ncbi:hypothetical protein NJT12_14145 [Flavobacterium sp. AC]|uniref:Uncharacterized protein n=1 Tax=Flavobacterium azizsancarii TaxID=2961580 RepID=A0ABT4WDU8_9FLAO|nr:hypothetical protein [Flavobacterium azizsancarii]MDA6070758.1 hypothetical protein [Flavobacterium azizsancarii]